MIIITSYSNTNSIFAIYIVSFFTGDFSTTNILFIWGIWGS